MKDVINYAMQIVKMYFLVLYLLSPTLNKTFTIYQIFQVLEQEESLKAARRKGDVLLVQRKQFVYILENNGGGNIT